jgi:hypothetical protein
MAKTYGRKMNVIKLKEFIDLIQLGDTGSPKCVAKKIGVSERLIYYYLSVLKKEFKAPVVFCRKRKTYYFTEKGILDLNWNNTQ